MVYVKIEIEVELPDNYSESVVDREIASAIDELGGQVLDSKDFVEISKEQLNQ